MFTIGNTYLFLLATEYIALFPVLKPFLKKINTSTPHGKRSKLKISVWKHYECPSLHAARFIQSVLLLNYYSQLKSGQSFVDILYISRTTAWANLFSEPPRCNVYRDSSYIYEFPCLFCH
jgi:hypothetical protein